LDDVARSLMMWILRGIADMETSSYSHFHVINIKIKLKILIILIYKKSENKI